MSAVTVNDAASSLKSSFDDMAASEALTRALVCERTEQPAKALFWVDVYLKLSGCRKV